MYLSVSAAEQECEKQGKHLLNDDAEADAFIDMFPGK